MSPDTWSITLNLISSAIAAAAVWVGGRVLSRRRLDRTRRFFGLAERSDCLLVVPRHMSTSPISTNRNDVAALLELSPILGYAQAEPEVVFHDQDLAGRSRTEFCVGGPAANRRTEAHLRSVLGGVRMSAERVEDDPTMRYRLTLHAGGRSYEGVRGRLEYAVLAKIVRDRGTAVFVICGQHASTNRATARFLAESYRDLIRTYGTTSQFCLVVEVVETAALGPNLVRVVDDLTATAFDPPRPPAELPASPRDQEPA